MAGFGSLANLYGFGSGMRMGEIAPPPSRRRAFSLADLMEPAILPEYPAEPDYPDTPGDLSPELRRRLRINRILAVIGAGGGAAGSGRMGTAMLGGLLQERDRESEVVKEEQRRMEETYGVQRREAERMAVLKADEQERKRKAEGLMSGYDAVLAAADETDTLSIDRAEKAARLGDRAALDRIAEDAAERKYWKAQGIDPDDSMAISAAKARAKAEEEERLHGPKLHTFPDEETRIYDRDTGEFKIIAKGKPAEKEDKTPKYIPPPVNFGDIAAQARKKAEDELAGTMLGPKAKAAAIDRRTRDYTRIMEQDAKAQRSYAEDAEPAARAKVLAVTDSAKLKQIATAREKGYTYLEIAEFLGL